MPVKVKCKGCSAVLNAPDRARGKAIKCPKCGKPVRIPAGSASGTPQQRKHPQRQGQQQRQKVSSPAPAPDDDDFLGGLDLGHVEDRTTRVCPKCGAFVGEEDIDCPSCGADVASGGLGRIQRIRAKRKGAAPEEFYSQAAGDAGSYLLGKMKLVWKSALILTIFPILATLATDMYIWCYNWPPKMFWLFVASVCGLFAPGWIWYVQQQFVLRILEPKRERYPVRLEAFSAIALGVKAVLWGAVFGLPLWVVFGIPAAAFAAVGSPMAAVVTFLIGVLLFGIILLLSWSIVQAHFAMPITWPGWMMHKVLPDVGRNLGPSLFAAAIAFGTGLFVVGVGAGAAFVIYPKQNELTTIMARHSVVDRAKGVIEKAEGSKDQPPVSVADLAKEEPPDIPWMNMLWPMAAQPFIAIALSLWLVYNARTAAFFLRLFRPNIQNLVAHEKEYVYEKRSALEEEALERERGPLSKNSVKSAALLGIVFSVLGGVSLSFVLKETFGYAGSFAVAIGAIAALMNVVADLLLLGKAFKKSKQWGFGKRAVYEGQLFMVSVGLLAVAGMLFALQVFVIAGDSGEKKKAAGEAGKQALQMTENLIALFC